MYSGITDQQIISFLCDNMHYDSEDLEGMPRDELLDGLNERKVFEHILNN